MLASRRRSVAYEPIVAPVLRGARYRDRPVYFSDVIVRARSGLRSFSELRGCTFAYNEPGSHSGYGVVRYKLVTIAETRGFFGRLVESGSHDRSIEMVAAGEADAAAIDSHVLALTLRDRPELAGTLRVIDTLGPSTIQPVVASRYVPSAVREAVRRAFLGMAEDPEAAGFMERGLIARFVVVDHASYYDIAAMMRTAEDAHFLVLK